MNVKKYVKPKTNNKYLGPIHAKEIVCNTMFAFPLYANTHKV